ncbi:MAG: exodeoxyribonuclease [Candidatus Nomurabacteria bacterium]|nr:exodeoxyribonuclease [Candidatus Nomurabacteria bacterium]
MKIISWNTNGLRATYKQGNFDPLFTQYKPDILCLQETKALPEQLPEGARDVFGYDSYFSWPEVKKGYSGVAIYTRETPLNVTLGIGLKGLDDEGRTITAEYETFYLITCYFPNGGGGPERLDYKLRFYDQFLKYITTLQKSKPVIFCGDINTAHNEIDLARPKENVMNTGFLPVERAWMDKLVKQGWVDTFRALYPDKKDVYTYWDQKTASRERNVGWRIDYFFVSADIADKVTELDTLKDYYGSDHCPIMLDIEL